MKLVTRVRSLGLFMLLGIGLGLTACAFDMRNQPRVDALEASTFFADGAARRSTVADTVARGELQLDEHLYTGRVNGAFATSFPFTVTLSVLERGQDRYEIFCTPCHGALGDGQGVITNYGLEAPTSFHDPGLRDEPEGYYFNLITNGTRVMPSYAGRIAPADRWAVIAYIRALQLSQNADVNQLSPEDLAELGVAETP
jgi:hypothetical protein